MKRIVLSIVALLCGHLCFAQGTQIGSSPLYYNSGSVNVGGNNNNSLFVRHLNGKEVSTTNADNLYLNYNTGKPVYIGYGTGLSNLYVSGNLGIGTTNPSTTLEIVDNSLPGIKVRHQNEQTSWGLSMLQGDDMKGHISMGGRDLQISTGWSHKLILGVSEYDNYGGSVVLPWGKVGIGTDTPTEKLEVAGNARIVGDIYSKKVKVSTNASNWPDYVFESDYQLTPLSQLEAFVKTNKHLPEVPSAKEVETNGQDLGDIQATLLKKIEELTLYTIDQEKKLEEKTRQIEALKKENKAIMDLFNELQQEITELKSNIKK